MSRFHCGPHLCSMKITGDVSVYTTTHGLKDEDALTRGLEEKSREFVEKGAEVYAKV